MSGYDSCLAEVKRQGKEITKQKAIIEKLTEGFENLSCICGEGPEGMCLRCETLKEIKQMKGEL